MNLELNDSVAIVTGSSRGLGLASARALLAEGCGGCICARGEERLNQAAAELRDESGSDERVLTVTADLTQMAGVESVVRETVGRFGALDILVNNVGRAVGGGLLEASDGDWTSAFENTLYPAIRASRMAVPHMRERGGGVILIIASIWGRESGGRMTYNAVKAAEPMANPLPIAAVVFPTASNLSVFSRTPGSRPLISAIPPALSAIGP